jgi:hypothetical protein
MKTRYAILSAFGLALMLCVNSVRASQGGQPGHPLRIPAWFDDQLVTLSIVNANVIGVDQQAIANEAANALYRVGYVDENGNWVDVQPHVISIGLGAAGYNPYWHVYDIEVSPADATAISSGEKQYKSEDDVQQSGYDPVDTGLILLCQQTSLSSP